MGFQNRKKWFQVIWIILWLTGCASNPSKPTSEAISSEPISLSTQTLSVCKKWDFPLHSNLAYLSISKDGGLILASTHKEHKSKDSSGIQLQLINSSKKKVLWTKSFGEPIKAQALSSHGDLIAITTYDDKLQVFDSHGNKLWEKPYLGRPLILSKSKRILLLNDDDSEPQTAFVTYDYKGDLQSEVKIESSSGREPLDTFVFSDEKIMLVSISGGGLAVFNLEGHLNAQGQIKGENVAAATKVTDQAHELYVLSSEKNQQYLTALDVGNERLLNQRWNTTLTGSYEALHILHDVIFLYGNSDQGQIVAAYNALTGKMLWRRSYPRPANYPSLFFAHESPDYVTVAIDTGEKPGTLTILAIGSDGNAVWRLPIDATDGIYSYAISQNPVTLAVGVGETGKSVIQYYKVGCKNKKN